MSLGVATAQRCLPRCAGLCTIPRDLPIGRARLFAAALHTSGRHGASEATVAGTATGARIGDEAAVPGRPTQTAPADRDHKPYRPENVLVKPMRAYKSPVETHLSRHRHHRSATTQLRHDFLRQIVGADVPDWREVLRFLSSATPAPRRAEKEQKVVKVVVAEAEVSPLLRHDEQDNIWWDIRNDLGCNAQRMHADGQVAQTQNGNSAVPYLLSGPRKSVEDALRHLQSAIRRGTNVQVSDYTASEPEGAKAGPLDIVHRSSLSPIALDLFEPHDARLLRQLRIIRLRGEWLMQVTMPASELPKPTKWTKTSFLHYVTLLTKSRLYRPLAADNGISDESYIQAVTTQLHAVFNSSATRSALSASAFKVALRFLADRGGSSTAHSRALFVRMVMYGMHIDAEVYNLVIKSLACRGDLRNFEILLKRMVKHGIAPDIRTWKSFLVLIKHYEVRKAIMRVMGEKGLLASPEAIREVDTPMIEEDLERHLRAGSHLTEFMAARDAVYGNPAWRNRASGNIMINVLCRHGRFETCKKLLETMAEEWHITPDLVALNTILTHCALKRVDASVKTAMDFCRTFDELDRERLSDTRPDAITLRLLFRLAYIHGLPHVLGIVWRYALATRQTSWRMRARVSKLVFNALERDRFLKRVVRKRAGRVERTPSVGQELANPSDERGESGQQAIEIRNFKRPGAANLAWQPSMTQTSTEDLVDAILFGDWLKLGSSQAKPASDEPATESEDVSKDAEQSARALVDSPAAESQDRDADRRSIWACLEKLDLTPTRRFGELLAAAYEADKKLIEQVAAGQVAIFDPAPFPLRR